MKIRHIQGQGKESPRLNRTGLEGSFRQARSAGPSGRGIKTPCGQSGPQERGAGIPGFRLLLLGVGCIGVTAAVWLGTSAFGGAGKADPASSAGPVREFALDEGEALALVRRALAVRDPVEMAGAILPGSASADDVMEFLEGIPEKDGAVTKMFWMGTMDGSAPLEGVTVVFDKAGEQSNRLALLTPGDDGKYRLDFEAFARWAQPGWNEILAGHSGPAVVRVFIGPERYYNGSFHDEDGWRCVGMASPDVGEILFGYVKADSPQDAAIRTLFKDARDAVRVVLKVRRPEGAESRQFEIVSVLARDWARGPISFDGQ